MVLRGKTEKIIKQILDTRKINVKFYTGSPAFYMHIRAYRRTRCDTSKCTRVFRGIRGEFVLNETRRYLQKGCFMSSGLRERLQFPVPEHPYRSTKLQQPSLHIVITRTLSPSPSLALSLSLIPLLRGGLHFPTFLPVHIDRISKPPRPDRIPLTSYARTLRQTVFPYN